MRNPSISVIEMAELLVICVLDIIKRVLDIVTPYIYIYIYFFFDPVMIWPRGTCNLTQRVAQEEKKKVKETFGGTI